MSYDNATVAEADNKKQDELYAYDGLNQITKLERGTLTGTPPSDITDVTWEDQWKFDPLGNWNEPSGTATPAPQSRSRSHAMRLNAGVALKLSPEAIESVHEIASAYH